MLCLTQETKLHVPPSVILYLLCIIIHDDMLQMLSKVLMGYLIVMICIDFRKRLLLFLWYCFQTYNISIKPLSWVLLYICHIFITWHFDDNGVNCFRCGTISLCTAKLRCLRTKRYLHGYFDIICSFIKLLWTGIFLCDRQCVSRNFDYNKHANVKKKKIFLQRTALPSKPPFLL